MTHDPHLPTLEQIMNGNNPFEILATPLGAMERWRAETMLIGTTGGIQSVYSAIRDDAATQAARADESEARNALIEHLCTKVDEFERRFADHEARLAAAEEKRRADEQAAREFEEEPIALPPSEEPGDPIAQDNINAHEPSGDLHTLGAKEEEPPEPLAEDEELPSELPQQAEFALPEPGMTTDARRKAPKGGAVSQPTAISLNED